MATSDSTTEYEPSYRERNVDQALDEHDRRISQNEKRWLMTKGALGMLAAVKGIDAAVGQLSSFI